MKVKIFEEADEKEIRLEEEINQWFGNNRDIEVKDIKQTNFFGGTHEGFSSGVTIAIFYIEKGE